ncbi:hypothetical protein BDV96DRAFT_608465 [Lophiotrema nucula]|uniref:Uncharacterized protein n=1 Tax=Lophiotrema nucula TaxID=690887 RepID=A0A6A5YFU0_9PLEO|nr:hypothetical protein BDV96DRAFT_608465 [Lophiotrema nucula]
MNNMLLQQENQRLNRALINEKKKPCNREAEKEATIAYKRQLKLKNIQRREAEKAEKVALAKQQQKRLYREEALQAKEANRQLQGEATIQRTSKKPTQAVQRLQQQAEEAQSGLEVVEGPEPANRRGRAIRLPTRFRD